MISDDERAMFRDDILNRDILDDAIGWIITHLNPEDVFTEAQLRQWAFDNDFANLHHKLAAAEKELAELKDKYALMRRTASEATQDVLELIDECDTARELLIYWANRYKCYAGSTCKCELCQTSQFLARTEDGGK